MSAVRRLRWVLTGAVLVLVGAWLALGLSPSVGVGPVTHLDLEAIKEESSWPDEVDRLVVVDPSDGTYDGMWTFRNEGLLPVSVRLADHGKPPELTWEATLHPYDERLNIVGDASESIQVARDGGLAVKFSWGAGCTTVGDGNQMFTGSVRLAVTQLGLTRVVSVPADQEIAFSYTEGWVPSTGCED